MSNRYITGNREQVAEYSNTSLGLQIIAVAQYLKNPHSQRKRNQCTLPTHCQSCSFWGSTLLELIAISSPLLSRLFSSHLDFAYVPVGAQLDSSVLYLEHTSHFFTSSVLLPVKSLVCGHSILPASAHFSVELVFVLSCSKSLAESRCSAKYAFCSLRFSQRDISTW